MFKYVKVRLPLSLVMYIHNTHFIQNVVCYFKKYIRCKTVGINERLSGKHSLYDAENSDEDM